MSRTKDQFIEKTGGFRLGETEAQFHARTAEIERLETSLKTARTPEQREKIQRELYKRRGIDFDED